MEVVGKRTLSPAAGSNCVAAYGIVITPGFAFVTLPLLHILDLLRLYFTFYTNLLEAVKIYALHS